MTNTSFRCKQAPIPTVVEDIRQRKVAINEPLFVVMYVSVISATRGSRTARCSSTARSVSPSRFSSEEDIGSEKTSLLWKRSIRHSKKNFALCCVDRARRQRPNVLIGAPLLLEKGVHVKAEPGSRVCTPDGSCNQNHGSFAIIMHWARTQTVEDGRSVRQNGKSSDAHIHLIISKIHDRGVQVAWKQALNDKNTHLIGRGKTYQSGTGQECSGWC